MLQILIKINHQIAQRFVKLMRKIYKHDCTAMCDDDSRDQGIRNKQHAFKNNTVMMRVTKLVLHQYGPSFAAAVLINQVFGIK